MKKVILLILVILVLTIASIGAYVKMALPNVGDAPDLKITITQDRIERGAYLANHITACMDCHSTRNWDQFSGPLVPETLGKGGEFFGQEMGFPGKFYAKNLTPSHLGNWTDGEIFRAITTGVNKDGKALFPVMPYAYYGKMDKEDVYDIIAYIRSLPSIENESGERELDFPMNFILNTIPKKAEPKQRPDKSNTIEYGGYLVQSAACMECHTDANKGQIIPEMGFAGGREFKMPNGMVRSANITPDMETGIGTWTEDMFVNRFIKYRDPLALPMMKHGQTNTIMPWAMYATIEDADLKAMFAYLQTLKPIKNNVVHFSN